MIWVWTALLIAGMALLAYTVTRVLSGGLLDSTRATPGAGDPGPPPSNDAASPGPSRARQILDERYAAGELSTQEYEERRAVLARGEDGP